jgi:hypothetical protein
MTEDPTDSRRSLRHPLDALPSRRRPTAHHQAGGAGGSLADGGGVTSMIRNGSRCTRCGGAVAGCTSRPSYWLRQPEEFLHARVATREIPDRPPVEPLTSASAPGGRSATNQPPR